MAWTYTLQEIAGMAGGRVEPAAAGGVTVSAVSTDTRTLTPGALFVALKGERFDGNDFVPQAFSAGAGAALGTQASDSGPTVVVPDALRGLQSFAAAHRARHTMPLLALTGSCGKTSTKDMVAHLLSSRLRVVKTQGNLNNEIGCPMSLLQLDSETQFAVIEMGANHMGEIASLCELAKPTEAVITLIAPAHLEGFGSVENVARAKGEIIGQLGVGGVFYVNADDARCLSLAERFEGQCVYVGRADAPVACDVTLQRAHFTAPGEMELEIAPVGTLRLPLACRAHVGNVLLAVAIGLRHGITEFEGPLREACAKASRFKVRTIGPLTVVDDTYNANPASMAASLEALAEWPGGGARFAALGDMLELGASAGRLHEEIGALCAALGIGHVFARGEHACDIIRGTRQRGVVHAETIEDPRTLAQAIHAVAAPGDLLLVKGSRGMRMERVIEALAELYG